MNRGGLQLQLSSYSEVKGTSLLLAFPRTRPMSKLVEALNHYYGSD